jgi:thiaminase (transcriptional activator TenA)
MTATNLPPFVEECRRRAEPAWTAYARHPWIEGLATGATTAERFVFFHRFDVVYAGDMHRSLAIGVAKAPAGSEWARAAIRVLYETFIAEKLRGKTELLRSIGSNEEVYLDRKDSIPSRDAYAAHLLRTAWEGSLGEIAASLLPCALFTELIGERFAVEPLPDPVYRAWADHYRNERDADMAFQHACVMQAEAEWSGPLGRDRMALAFSRSVHYQVRVFDAAWSCQDPWDTTSS